VIPCLAFNVDVPGGEHANRNNWRGHKQFAGGGGVKTFRSTKAILLASLEGRGKKKESKNKRARGDSERRAKVQLKV